MAKSRGRTRIQKPQPNARGKRAAAVPTAIEDRSESRTEVHPFDALLAFALACIVGSLFWVTAARDIVVGDTGDFLTTGATLGVAHPPGYPLLVLLAHGFGLLPIGAPAFRMNLIAVVSGAITVGLVFSTVRRLGPGRWAAVVAALALALNPLFWEWSLAIEAFPLNNALAALLIYFMVRWEAEPERTRFLVAAALAGGLGAANHLTIVFLIPFVAVVAWRKRHAIGISAALLCGAAIVLGLTPYLYVPWAASRHPFLNWGNVASAHDLLRLFLRSDYGTGRLVAAGSSPGSPWDRLSVLRASFTLVEGTLVVVGAARAYLRMRWYFWACLTSFAVAGPIFVAYANIDVGIEQFLWAFGRFLLLPHVIVAPLVAFGVVACADIIATALRRVEPNVVTASFAACLTLILALSGVLHFKAADQRQNHLAATFARDVLATLEPNAVLLARGDEVVFPVAYAQAVGRARPDVTLVMLGLLSSYPWYITQLRQRDPGLVIPFDRYDPGRPTATLRALVDANPGRQFALVGAPTDASLSRSYWLYRRGLVEQIEPLSTDIGLDQASNENERLLGLYRIPDASKVRRNTFEIGILAKYAAAPKFMGSQHATMHLDRQAEAWYRRALRIDPNDAEAREAVEKLTATTSR